MRSKAALPFARLGEYELVRLLATGGMSEVYEARREGPRGFQKRFALKRVLPQLAAEERLLRMFCDEARVHSALNHPNLVQVVDFGDAQGELFMVMEFVDGPSLSAVMSALSARSRRMPMAQALYIVRSVLEGLCYAHTARDPSTGLSLGVVHRDVAPTNILIGHAGEVKLADFGIVSSLINDGQSSPGEIKGKLGYISPEQAVGARVDARSDLFSLAVVLAEMLIGCPLFVGRTPLEILESLYAGDLRLLDERGGDLPAELLATLRKALSQEPADRHTGARQFADELELVARRQQLEMTPNRLLSWMRELGIVSLRSDVRAMIGTRPVAPSFMPRINSLSSLPARPTVSGGLQEVTLTATRETEVEYRVRRPGGSIVGPLRLAKMLEMIATARAGVDTQVSRAGGPFLPLSSVYELARLASQPAFRFFDPVALLATERSSIDRVTLPSKLYGMALGRKNGLLAATAGCERFRAFFMNGELSVCASTEPSELLGACLVQTGQVEAKVMDDQIEKAFRRGQRLGEALVATGRITVEALARTLTAQRVRRLAGLLEWSRGDLVFVEGAHGAEQEREPSTARLLTSALRAAYRDDEIAELLSPFRQYSAISTADFDERLPELGLDASESSILCAFSRGGVLKDMVARTADRQGLGWRVLFIGMSAGLLTVEGSPL